MSQQREIIDARLVHQQGGPLGFRLVAYEAPGGGRASWNPSFPGMALHAVLNACGEGLVMGSAARLTVLPETVAMFHAGQGEVMATRFPGAGGHEFLVLSLSAEAVLGIFGGRAAIPGRNYGLLRRWTERERQIYRDLRSVPVAEVAHAAWYQAKVMELLSLHLFHARAPEPLFCTEVKIRGHRHVREALGLLRARLAEPLDLARLARDVGCAPHYLSRLVSQETGKTLSLHLRKFRIERARELLAGNRLSVTEVAFEVGYSSLSHFSKAFALEAGLTPSDFLKRQRA